MANNDKLIKDFLNRCNIVFTEFSQLEGMNIPRETLLSKEVYDKVKGDNILLILVIARDEEVKNMLMSFVGYVHVFFSLTLHEREIIPLINRDF